MSRQTLTIIIIVLIFLLIIGGMVWFFLFRAPVPTAPGEEAPGGFFGGLFPGGEPREPGGGGVGGSGDPGDIDAGREGEPAPRLRLVSREPVAGAIIFGEATSTTIRYIERATGHIYETEADTLGRERISNETVPSIQRAFFGPSGETLALQYIDGANEAALKTFAGVLDESATTSTTATYDGIFLPDDISAFDRAPGSGDLVWMSENSDGSALFTALPNGDAQERIDTFSVREWNIEWSTQNTLLLTTRPSQRAGGVVFALNLSTGARERLIGGIRGLTATLSPDGNHLLYSESEGDSITLHRYSRESGEELDIPQTTIPSDKCAWADNELAYCAVPNTIPAADYPDVWYQGRIQFTDSIWLINTDNGASERIVDPVELVGEEIDAINLSLSEDGGYLIFQNKRDLRLWSLRIAE